MGHEMHHTLLGFCWWDIPAAIILIGIIVFLVVRHRKHDWLKLAVEIVIVIILAAG